MRIFYVVIIFLLLLSTGYYFLHDSQLFGGNNETTYVTAPATRGRLLDDVSSSGTINAVVTVAVGSQLSGQIASLRADFNDIVRKGQILAVLDQQSYRARLAEAQAALEMAQAFIKVKNAELQRSQEDLRKAQANRAVLEARRDSARALLASAREDLARKEKLGTSGNVAASALSEARAAFHAAAAGLREAEANLDAHEIDLAAARADVAREAAELENARANVPEKQAKLTLAEVELERTTIRSPIDGIVIKRDVNEGQTVAASLEAPTLFTIAQDLSDMEVHARIDETDIGRIRVGQRATFRVDAYPGRRFTGEVTQIRKAAEAIQNVVTYTVVIRTRNEDLLLLPGMTALVDIIVMQSDEKLLIPSAALRYAPRGQVNAGGRVWKLVDGVPAPVEVATGPSDSRHTAVVGGEVQAGDEVITSEIVQQASRDIFGIRFGF